DFAKAFVVQNNHFIDPPICPYPLNAGAPVGDDTKGADDQYLPLLLRAFDNLEDSDPCREGLSQSDIVCQKKAWIAVFVGVEDLLHSNKAVRSDCYQFLCRNNWAPPAVQLPLDLLFPTELLWFEPLKFERQRLSGPFFEEIGFDFGVPPRAALKGDVTIVKR